MNKMRVLMTLPVAALWLLAYAAQGDGGENASDSTSSSSSVQSAGQPSSGAESEKPCLKTMIKRSGERAKQSIQAIDGLIQDLDKAKQSGDPDKMKSTIENAQKTLTGLRQDNSKSSALLDAAHKHLEKIHKRADTKTKRMIDQTDPDFDDLIWAF